MWANVKAAEQADKEPVPPATKKHKVEGAAALPPALAPAPAPPPAKERVPEEPVPKEPVPDEAVVVKEPVPDEPVPDEPVPVKDRVRAFEDKLKAQKDGCA